MRFVHLLLLPVLLLLSGRDADAFFGFYAAKAAGDLANRSSKVVVVRDGDRTVLTLVSDYKGDPKDFALIVPVPEILERKQLNVGDPKIVERLDAFSSPRLVESMDHDPCAPPVVQPKAGAPLRSSDEETSPRKGEVHGVHVEAAYEVGEYDVLILSAKESEGLARWLRREGYKVPRKLEPILRSYVKRGLKFLVARVSLERQASSDFHYLRPLQLAFESKRLELPIRLGTVNASGAQDLLIFALTREGRVEAANYPNKRVPTGVELPLFVKQEREAFYRDMFATQVKKEGAKAVFLEHAWDASWCDPCTADPLTDDELRSLGVYWVGKGKDDGSRRILKIEGRPDVFVTRLHVRYASDSHPEDLQLRVTSDRNQFQVRYVLRHPFHGEAKCPAGEEYAQSLPARQEKEAQELSRLTGWDVDVIRRKMKIEPPKSEPKSWIDDLWK